MSDEEPTDEAIIERYIEIRDKVEAKQEAFDASLKPFKEAMTILEGVMHQRLMDRKSQSVTTDKGTAYRSSIMSPKVADRNIFHAWVFQDFIGRQPFLTAAISKEALKEYMDKEKERLQKENPDEKPEVSPPPGIDVTWIFKTNFRRKS